MRFLILGDDARQEYLRDILKERSQDVVYSRRYDRNICKGRFDAVLLPVPASAEYYSMVENILSGDEYVFGCNIHSEVATCAKSTASCNCRKIEYMKSDEVACKNAIATAEGTIAEIIRLSQINIQGSSCLVIGYGRCAKVLALKLKLLGCDVTVMERNNIKRVQAQVEGMRAVDFVEHEYQACGKYDYIINTVPAMVVDKKILEFVKPDVLILDIASKPGGVDYEYCSEHDLRAVLEAGLPGRFAPKTSAEILLEVIEKNIELDN